MIKTLMAFMLGGKPLASSSTFWGGLNFVVGGNPNKIAKFLLSVPLKSSKRGGVSFIREQTSVNILKSKSKNVVDLVSLLSARQDNPLDESVEALRLLESYKHMVCMQSYRNPNGIEAKFKIAFLEQAYSLCCKYAYPTKALYSLTDLYQLYLDVDETEKSGLRSIFKPLGLNVSDEPGAWNPLQHSWMLFSIELSALYEALSLLPSSVSWAAKNAIKEARHKVYVIPSSLDFYQSAAVSYFIEGVGAFYMQELEQLQCISSVPRCDFSFFVQCSKDIELKNKYRIFSRASSRAVSVFFHVEESQSNYESRPSVSRMLYLEDIPVGNLGSQVFALEHGTQQKYHGDPCLLYTKVGQRTPTKLYL